jgi:serine/threonine protein kinase
MIGQTILHYKILEKLGEGGMGVVYKARDTKLNRIVALKFLPDRVNQDNTAKERFLQEAQAVAALNHSHICTIYGIEEFNESVFMVMEFLEGGTLSDKLPYHKINDALKIAVEIGEALQEAHSKGIVHRDIKADNIMLTSNGQARVMDFGLAKLKGALRLTKSLSTVGTLGYMSPEQIQGGEVDNRSDIFSFGVLLFEMLTGSLPFRGEHEAAIVYSVVNEEPQNIATLVPDLSPLVVNLIQRCLEKDPEDRYQTMKDAVSELRRAMKKSSGSMAKSAITRRVDVPGTSEVRSAEQPLSTKTQKSFLQLKYIIGLAGLVVIAIVTYLFLRKGTPELNPAMTFRTIQMPLTQFNYPGISQDGKYIVFPAADANGKWDIYWMNNAGGEARRITFDSSATPIGRDANADISPDGSQIVYNRWNSKTHISEVCVVSSNGGTGRKIADKGSVPRWKPDGTRIGFIVARILMPNDTSKNLEFHSVKPDGSDERIEFVESQRFILSNWSFSWSPDGESIAWIRTFPDNSAEVIVHNLISGKEKQLTFDKAKIDEVFWAKDNMIIFSSSKSGNTNLWCVPAGGGKEIQITKGAGPDLGIQVSADCNKLLYYQNQEVGYIWSGNGSGTDLHQLTFDNQIISSVALSNDSRYIAFSAGEDQGVLTSAHLFVMNSDGSDRHQLTFGDEDKSIESLSFSPDGEQIAYSTLVNDTMKIKLIDFPNAVSPKIIHTGIVIGWIDDNNIIELDVQGTLKTWKIPINGGPVTRIGQDSTFGIPIENNKYIVYLDSRKGHEGLWIKAAGSKDRPLLSLIRDNVKFMSWPKSRFLYYVTNNGILWKLLLPEGKKEKLQGTLLNLTSPFSFSSSNDGELIVYVNHQSRGKLVMIDNLFN